MALNHKMTIAVAPLKIGCHSPLSRSLTLHVSPFSNANFANAINSKFIWNFLVFDQMLMCLTNCSMFVFTDFFVIYGDILCVNAQTIVRVHTLVCHQLSLKVVKHREKEGFRQKFFVCLFIWSLGCAIRICQFGSKKEPL